MRYFVLHGDYEEWFTCEADDAGHAMEQSQDAGCGPVHGVWMGVTDEAIEDFFDSVEDALSDIEEARDRLAGDGS